MILDLFFPKQCLECKKEGKYICKSCLEKVPVCGWYNGNYSIFRYKGVIRKAIISLKYKFAYDLSNELSLIIIKRLENIYFPFKNIALVPIPLHIQRENWRGFNQSKILGETIASEMKWKYFPNLLIKYKKTNPQVNLKGIDRRKNLSGVFVVNPTFKLPLTSNLILFDDVYTTGSTINEAKKALKDVGFSKIYSLTIAR
jgi:ComF family protein